MKRKLKKSTMLIAQHGLEKSRPNSKSREMFQTVMNGEYEWNESKANRWIGYAQCLLVAEGVVTIDRLRRVVNSCIKEGEKE